MGCDMSELTFEQAQKVILAAEQVARNAESSEQEISLFSAFFDSAVGLLSEDQMIQLAGSLAKDVDDEIAHEPYDTQAQHVVQIEELVAIG